MRQEMEGDGSFTGTEAAQRVRIFAVESWGCAGTHWLAHALDTHPELRCFHNANGQFARLTGGKRVEGVEYVRLLRAQRLGYRVVGDVHGFTRESIPEVKKQLGDRFRCAVLVRDPIPRYRSQLALFKHGSWRQDRNSRPWKIDYVVPRARAAGIEIDRRDYDQCLVVHAACMLDVIVQERALGPIVRMEDIVSSPDALSELVTILTAGEIEPGRDWAEQAVSRPRLASHNRGEELTPLERHALERIVTPDAWQAYRELGYDC